MWYLRETEVHPQHKHNKVGIDLGVKTKAVLSDGTSYVSRTLDIKSIERRLGRAQKNLSRKIKRSRNYEKQRIKVAKLQCFIEYFKILTNRAGTARL
jgi:putative transposase